MKIKTKTKNTLSVILALSLLLLFTLNAADFEKVWDMKTWIPPGYEPAGFVSPRIFKQFYDSNTGGLTHFPQGGQFSYYAIDKYNNKKEYTNDNTGKPVQDYYWQAQFIYLQSLGVNVLKSPYGLLFIESPETDPQFTNYIAAEDLPGYPHKDTIDWNPPLLVFEDIESIYSTNDGGWVNFYLTSYDLYKVNKDMTELLASYELPNKMALYPGSIIKHIYPGGLDEFWLPIEGFSGSSLFHFDVRNEEWTIYDYPDIPIAWDDGHNLDPENGIFSYIPKTGFLDWNYPPVPQDEYIPKPILPIHYFYRDGNNYYTDNALLYFNRNTNKFDTIRIDLTNAQYWKEHPNMYVIGIARRISSLRKILLTFYCPWQYTIQISSKYFMLFDWETKTFEVLAPDNSLITNSHQVSYVGDYIDAQGNQCIGLLYSNGDFFSYNPKTGIFNLESSAIPNLWFRSVYPNPTQQRIVNANIMCYVEDLSKIDISLYNLMGIKLLDLNDDYEYNEATKTIYVTFKVPKDIPVGTYYLNVNNGTEHRTQMIVISE